MNRDLLQRALDALIGARDSVSNELSNSIYHTASSRIIEQITDDLAKADASIAELRDALAVGDTPSPGEPAIPLGFVLVPVEPTIRQLAAMGPAIRACYGMDGTTGNVGDVYRAMIEAAPKAPHATPPDVQRDAPQLPDGFELVAVKGFDDLMYWLGRCADKGHLEQCSDLIEPWDAFDYRKITTAPKVTP